MSSILTPGYLRWDGYKYVLDHDVEIVGPPGSAGVQGPTGLQGVPGIGVGASATGDLSGIYPGPISVIGLTGVSGIVSFGSGVSTPTITQASTVLASGQAITLKGQGAVTTGGNVVLQSGTGATTGVIQFLLGNTTAGLFDANGTLRIGPNASSSVSVFGSTAPIAGNDTLFSYNGGPGQSSVRVVSAATANRAIVEAINSSSGASASVAMRVMASGSTEATTNFAGNGILEQVGTATSALLFSKALGDLTSRGTTGRIWQSGAWGVGDAATNNTSAAAQAGLTGALVNIAPTTGGTLTSAANQGIVYNTAGTLNVQGNIGVTLISGTTTVASTTTSKFVTNQGRRIKVVNTTSSPYNVLTTDEVVSVGGIAAPFTVNLPAGPTQGDTYVVKDANGSATTFNITVSGNGNNIDGAATYVMTTNYMSVTFVYNGTKWIAAVGPPGPQGPQGIPGASFNISSTVTTVDATTTTLATLALSDLTFTGIDVIVIGKKSGTADGAKFNLSMAYIRQGAGPVGVGTVTSYDQRSTAGASTWTTTITTSGNNAIVTVTGQAATTIDWEAQLQYVVVS